MPKFSRKSKEKLESCHPDIQRVMRKAIKGHDFTIIYGRRNEADQNEAFEKGYSKKRWPDSAHNALGPMPSRGIDIAPWPIDWNDHKQFLFLAGYVSGIAEMMGVELISGADWDSDGDLSDQRFNDLGHFELKPE